MIRRYLVLVALLFGVALAVGALVYLKNRPQYSPLTGQSVAGDIANRRAIAVTIDNLSPDARPQAGLADASLVFETLAEGGITRFMAVFDEHDSAKIGPVRSTRYYFNSWAAGLGVIFGHDGGNVDSLQELPSLTSVYNIDADRVKGPFYRTTDRLAPHNEYTSTGALRSYASAHGGSITGPPPAIPHKDDASASGRPASFTLNTQFSYGDYNVTWKYDRAANDYLRFMGGIPHVDAGTGKQLTAKNIVVVFAAETPAPDPYTPGAIHMQTLGSGKATVYRDGQSIAGTWSKASNDSPLEWLDSNGNQIPLDRGNTWIEVVPTGNQVTTSP
jgi:Protein of unknown function (DUF3048) N-terminal domain/Protein of unknown function (DUF3048) C-terminal domain